MSVSPHLKRTGKLGCAALLIGVAAWFWYPRGETTAQRSAENQARSGYVAAGACAVCHPQQAKSYGATGMARSLYRPTPERMVEDFTQRNTFFHRASERYYTMLERDGKYFQKRHQKGFNGSETNIVEQEIEYVIGSGNHARSYLSRAADGTLVELPVSWYSERGGYWAMSPGYDRANHQDFRRAVQADCLACHNAYPRAELGVRLPEGIDCQRCHGPGEAHVRAASEANADRGKIRGLITNPKLLTRDRQLDVCMQCHLETTSSPLPHMVKRAERAFFSYKPGEPLGDFAMFFDHAPGSGHDDNFEIAHAAYRLRKSACFQASQMTCTTCHDPHSVPRGDDAAAHYVSTCQKCHETPHKVARIATAGKSCLDCHMPKRRTEDAVHVVMTDHFIQRHKPAGDLLAMRSERDGSEAYKGKVTPYYPTPTPKDDLVVALAQVQHGSNLEAGIPMLRAAIEKTNPPEAEYYYELGRAYGAVNQQNKAISWLEKAVSREPVSKAAVNELVAALLAAGQLSRAADLLEKKAGSDAVSVTNLANVYLRQGAFDRAEETATRALRLKSDHPEAHQVAGLTAVHKGNRAAAEASFRDVIRLQPDHAEAQHHLGRLLAERRAYEEARFHVAKAVAANPEFAEARHTYGLLFLVLQQPDRALLEFQEAVRLAPSMAQAHSDLADVLAAKGRVPDAIREYELAVQANPQLYEAHLSLGIALGRRGSFDKARTHLQKASESSNPEVRQAAVSALGLTPR